MSNYDMERAAQKAAARATAAAVLKARIKTGIMWGGVGLVAVVLIFTGLFVVQKTVSRWQARADRNQNRSQQRLDANNEVAVNAIRIRTFQQKVKIAQQQAQIRFVNSTGIKRAQDEIAKTLTPLYVQFEMTEALKQIAVSGRNSSVIYIPSGPAGIPFIEGAGAKVGAGSSTGK